MEFHLPSYFDENGVNILSPINQMMNQGGTGSMSVPSERPSMDYYYNQLNPPWYQQMIEQSKAQQNYQQQYGYQQQYDPYQQYNPYAYQQQYVPVDQYTQAYNQGAMPLSQYTFYNTPWYMVDNGYSQQQSTDEWYGYAIRRREKQLEEQKYQQEIYESQVYTIDIINRLCAKHRGEDPDKIVSYNKKAMYYQKLNEYRAEEAKREYQNDYLYYYVMQLPNSNMKGYTTPLVEALSEKWNAYYDHRNSKYPEKYGVDEYFTWIYGSQMLDMWEDEAREKEKDLSRLYDQQEFRNFLHTLNPAYDPVAGVSLAGAKRLGVDDIEITLPPHLAKQEYVQRRQKFIDSIFKDNRLNL